MSEPRELTIREAAGLMKTGKLTAERLVKSCLERIHARKGTLHTGRVCHPRRDPSSTTRRDMSGKPLPWGTTQTLANGLHPFGWTLLKFVDLQAGVRAPETRKKKSEGVMKIELEPVAFVRGGRGEVVNGEWGDSRSHPSAHGAEGQSPPGAREIPRLLKYHSLTGHVL
jgi:hypothetical protein